VFIVLVASFWMIVVHERSELSHVSLSHHRLVFHQPRAHDSSGFCGRRGFFGSIFSSNERSFPAVTLPMMDAFHDFMGSIDRFV